MFVRGVQGQKVCRGLRPDLTNIINAGSLNGWQCWPAHRTVSGKRYTCRAEGLSTRASARQSCGDANGASRGCRRRGKIVAGVLHCHAEGGAAHHEAQMRAAAALHLLLRCLQPGAHDHQPPALPLAWRQPAAPRSPATQTDERVSYSCYTGAPAAR